MKKVTIMLTLLCAATFAQQKGTLTDSRDGKKYNTVKIGTQTWMAQNLNYKPEEAASPQTAATPTAKAAEGGYGLGAAGFTAPGSALPGAEFSAALQLKNVGTEEMPGGDKGIALIGSGGEIVEVIGKGGFGKMGVGFTDKKPVDLKCKIPATIKPGKYSLRLVIKQKGQTDWKVVTDAVGNVPTAIEFTVIGNASSWCYEDSDANCEKYGRLYSWEMADKVCPAGWHMSSGEEWEKLNQTAGTKKKEKKCSVTMGGSVCYNEEVWAGAGKKLKAKNGWNKKEDGKSSGNGTDNYGFSALPAGDAGNFTCWAGGWGADSNDDNLVDGCGGEGVSVRCIKD